MEKGTHVRHRAKPEWGVGIALDDSNGGKCRIQFEGYGVVTLDLAAAGRNLEELGPDEVTAHVAAHRPPAGQHPVAAHGNYCAHCREPLKNSFYGPGKAWKSCPRCSSLDGAEHVFYEHPDAFGTSDARISDDTPLGVQSYCKTCRPRVRQEPTARSRRCSDVRVL